MQYLVQLLYFILNGYVLGTQIETSWLSCSATVYKDDTINDQHRTFGIGYTNWAGYNFQEQANSVIFYNRIPSISCVYNFVDAWWRDPQHGYYSYQIVINPPKNQLIQFLYKDTIDFDRIWPINNLCFVKLFIQDNNNGWYCGTGIGSYFSGDLAAKCSSPWDGTNVNGKYVDIGRNPKSYIRSIDIVGDKHCKVIASDSLVLDCSTSASDCLTLSGEGDSRLGVTKYNPTTSTWPSNNILSLKVYRAKAIHGKPTWELTDSHITSSNTIQSSCVQPGTSWTYEHSATTGTSSSISVTSSTTISLSSTVTWEASFGIPEIGSVGSSVSLTVGASQEFSTQKTNEVSKLTIKTLKYSATADDKSRLCRIVQSSYKYVEPYTASYLWVDDYGYTQSGPFTGTWNGVVSGYNMICEYVESCTGTSSTTSTGTRRRRRLINFNDLKCGIIGLDDANKTIIQSNDNVELVIDDDNSFANITQLQLINNDNTYDCNVYFVLDNINTTYDVNDAYHLNVMKFDYMNNDINNYNLENYSAILTMPESTYCQVSLWDNNKLFECGPFGVGNYGTNMISERSNICKAMMNGSIIIAQVDVEGYHQCLAHLYESIDHLVGKNLDDYTETNTVQHGPGFTSINTSHTYIALKVIFQSDISDAIWDLNNANKVDTTNEYKLGSNIYVNYGSPVNNTFIDTFYFHHYEVKKAYFTDDFTTFTWLPQTYGLPLVDEVTGILYIETNVPFDQFSFSATNKSVYNDTTNVFDVSYYNTYSNNINLTVNPNITMECNWIATYGEIEITANYTYVEFKDGFIATFTDNVVTFYRDYIYDFSSRCYQIDTPQQYHNLTEYQLDLSNSDVTILNETSTTQVISTDDTTDACSMNGQCKVFFIILSVITILFD
eukprot:229580_1